MLDTLEGAEIRIILLDLERWTEDHLEKWLKVHLGQKKSCVALADLIDKYFSVATRVYSGNPEEVSHMLLTVMELWIALDRCTTHQYPLLAEYDHGFPSDVLEPLLLPKKKQMQRLLTIENSLAIRKQATEPTFPSVLETCAERNSFSVRYFDRSPYHQHLRQVIEADAYKKRTAKLIEYKNKSEEYNRLTQSACGMSCEYNTRMKKRRARTTHSQTCQKCDLERKASNLEIHIFEWPLPNDELQVKASVFELDIPLAIATWRDTTYKVHTEILSTKPSAVAVGSDRLYYLDDYSGLVEHAKRRARRVQLASIAKPFVLSHYSRQKVCSANETTVCVNNGLQYSFYDSGTNRRTTKYLGQCNIRNICTFMLPSGAYSGLQYAVDNTTHTSNEVLAYQSKCPENLLLTEYYAFATLRAGHRLQWRNTARELVSHSLSLNREETYLLLAQTAWQVGPNNSRDLYRDAHIDLQEEEFCLCLLSALDDVLEETKGNWQGIAAVRTTVIIAARVLSLSASDIVSRSGVRHLRSARKIIQGVSIISLSRSVSLCYNV